MTARANDRAQSVPEKLHIERLARLGKSWGAVRYTHPFLAYRELECNDVIGQALHRRATGRGESAVSTLLPGFAVAVAAVFDAN